MENPFWDEIAKFLSKHIGTLEDQLDDDPFLEILASKQGIAKQLRENSRLNKVTESHKQKSMFSLMEKSYEMNVEKISSSLTSRSYETRGGSNSSGGVNPLILYQLVDSCVPSGGFAHSNTLEAAHQLHLLECKKSSWTASLYGHIWDVTLTTVTSTIPFLISSCSLFRNHYYNNGETNSKNDTGRKLQVDSSIVDEWEEIDRQLRATITSHVACRASTTQGSGMLRAFAAAFPNIAPVVKALKKRTLRVDSTLSDCTGHAATCFGAVCGTIGIDEETCSSMFLYTTVRDMVNAAVRMNLIGPLEGGRLTNDLCNDVEKLVVRQIGPRLSCRTAELDTAFAHQVCPLVEILSNAHDRLYTRLFNS